MEDNKLFASEGEDKAMDPNILSCIVPLCILRSQEVCTILMVKDLLGQVKVTLETLSDVARGSP